VLASSSAETTSSARLVFTTDHGEPDVRLGFKVADLDEAVRQVEGLGGQIDRADDAVVRGWDSQGTLQQTPEVDPRAPG
jgi:hypothetical protein